MRKLLISVALAGCVMQGCAGFDAQQLNTEATRVRETAEQMKADAEALRASGQVVPGSKADEAITKFNESLDRIIGVANAAQNVVNEDGSINAGGVAAAAGALHPAAGPIAGLVAVGIGGIITYMNKRKAAEALAEAEAATKALKQTVVGIKGFLANGSDDTAKQALKEELASAQDADVKAKVAEIKNNAA